MKNELIYSRTQSNLQYKLRLCGRFGDMGTESISALNIGPPVVWLKNTIQFVYVFHDEWKIKCYRKNPSGISIIRVVHYSITIEYPLGITQVFNFYSRDIFSRDIFSSYTKNDETLSNLLWYA